MFNLYQNSAITEQLIETGQLNLCKLGICLCVMIDEQFQPVSSWSFSRIIRDGKINLKCLKILTVLFFQNGDVVVDLLHFLEVKTKQSYLLLRKAGISVQGVFVPERISGDFLDREKAPI